jgi:hypothetical protein
MVRLLSPEQLLLIETELSIGSLAPGFDPTLPSKSKKADVGGHLKMFSYVGLLFDEPPGIAELSFTKSSDQFLI